MKLALSAATSLAFIAGLANAAMCVQTSLIGIDGLPERDTFVLYARNSTGGMLPVTATNQPLPGGFFFPVKLGAANEKTSSLPYFQLQSGQVYAYGGEIFATMTSPTLAPVPLYVAADTSEVAEKFYYVNATCDGKTEKLLRFANVTPIPIGSASINGSFERGTPLLSPVLDNILTLPAALDLVIQHI